MFGYLLIKAIFDSKGFLASRQCGQLARNWRVKRKDGKMTESWQDKIIYVGSADNLQVLGIAQRLRWAPCSFQVYDSVLP